MKEKGLLVRIIFMLLIIVISYFLWDYKSINESATLASSFDDMDIFVYVEQPESLNVISTNKALEYIDPSDLVLRNKNKFNKNVDLVLLINKMSTIDKDYIRVSIDDTIYELNNMSFEEDEENYYYKLNNLDIEAYSSKELKTRIWLDDKINTINENAFLTTNFIVK